MLRVDFYFDVVCPYAYLAATQLEGLAERTGATIVWRPMLLGGVFQAIGAPNDPGAVMSPSRAEHNRRDAIRWADHLQVPFSWHPNHPVRTLKAMRVLTALSNDSGELEDPTPARQLFQAYHVAGAALDDDDALFELISRFHAADPSLLERAYSPENKARLREWSTAAAARGVFGAPALFIDDELFWGVDRLELLESRLTRGRRQSMGSTGPRSPRTD